MIMRYVRNETHHKTCNQGPNESSRSLIHVFIPFPTTLTSHER